MYSVADSVSHRRGGGKAGPFWSGRIVHHLSGTTLRGPAKPPGWSKPWDRWSRSVSTPKTRKTADQRNPSFRENWRRVALVDADRGDDRRNNYATLL